MDIDDNHIIVFYYFCRLQLQDVYKITWREKNGDELL